MFLKGHGPRERPEGHSRSEGDAEAGPVSAFFGFNGRFHDAQKVWQLFMPRVFLYPRASKVFFNGGTCLETYGGFYFG